MVTQKEIKENNGNGTNTRKIVYKGPGSDHNFTPTNAHQKTTDHNHTKEKSQKSSKSDHTNRIIQILRIIASIKAKPVRIKAGRRFIYETNQTGVTGHPRSAAN